MDYQTLTQPVGDTPLWEIIVGVSFVAIFIIASFIYHDYKLKKDKQLYPTISQVKKASKRQINKWVLSLPVASNEYELKIMDKIARRYLDIYDPHI